MGLYDYLKDKAGDAQNLLDKVIPDPIQEAAKSVPIYGELFQPQRAVTETLRPFVATTNLFRGAGGTVVVIGKNLLFDSGRQIFGNGDRVALWEDPLAAIIQYGREDIARDILGLPLDPENEGMGSGYGLFARKGLGGGTFGLVPEEIRDVTRPAVQEGVEGLHWAFNNLVDNPLSMTFTMINRVQNAAGNNPLNLLDYNTYSVLFDANEWKQAYDVAWVQERSAGQALATGVYAIDPFDEEAYNAIKTNDLFTVISGTADLIKEWKDPLERAIRGTKNISRGETAIVKLNDAGDLVRIYDYGVPFMPVRQAMPNKIWVVEGTGNVRKIVYDKDITTSAIQKPDSLTPPQGMVSKVKDRFNKPNNLTEQDLALRKTVTTEQAKGMAESKWFNDTWNTVMDAVPDNKFSAQYKSSKIVSTNADQTLINERGVRWRQAAGRKNNTKLPERVQTALATAPSKLAAQRILREYLGDTTVKGEIAEVIRQAGAVLIDSDYGKKIKLLDDVDRAITRARKRINGTNGKISTLRNRIEKLQEKRELISTEVLPVEIQQARRISDSFEGGIESVDDTRRRILKTRRAANTREINALKQEIEDLKVERVKDENFVREESVRNDALEAELKIEGQVFNDVHWEYHFDFYNQIKVSQQKKVTLDANGDVSLPKSQVNEWDDLDRITAQIVVDKIVEDALLADNIVKSVGNRKIYQPIGVVHRNHLNKVKETTGNKFTSNHDTVVTTFDKAYSNPSVFLPLGIKALKIFTSRVPQGLIHFTDLGGQSTIMFERVIEDASEFVIGGKRLLSEKEAVEILGKWNEYVFKGEDYSTFVEYYTATMNKLVYRAEGMMRKQDIKIYDDTGALVDIPKDYLVKQLNGAQKDFLNRLDNKEFKPIDMSETKYTVDETGMRGKRIYDEDGQLVTERKAYTEEHTYTNVPVNEGIHTYTYNLSLAQLAECSIIPRFDLLQREINRSMNRTDYFGSGKRGTQKEGKLVDLKRSKYAKAVPVAAKGLQEVWTAGKLLTPRWTVRVLTDEKLRAAAVMGVLPMLGTLNKGFNRWVQNMQARGLNLTDEGFSVALRNELNKDFAKSKDVPKVSDDATLIDIVKFVEERGLNLEAVMDSASARYIEDALRAKEEATKISPSRRKGLGVTARALVGGMVNPLLGAGWGFRYWKNRTKNLQKYAVKSSAAQLANAFQIDAARIIGEAADDITVIELAERLSSSGDQLLKDLAWLEDEYNFGLSWADKDKVVSLFDQADMWWEKAGYPRQTIGNATFGNAWGSDLRFQRMSQRQLSSANSLDTSMRGPVAAAKRQINENIGEGWEIVDVLKEGVTASQMRTAWTRTYMQMSRTGTKEIQFYNIMYNDSLSHVQKVEAIAALIENTDRLQRKFQIKGYEGKGADRKIFKEIAEDAIDEVNDFLPPEYFPDLRAKVRAGEEISWDDVKSTLTDPEFIARHGFNGSKANEIIAQIRIKDNSSRGGFGKARDSISQPSAKQEGFIKWTRDLIDKTFQNLGTGAADDISRGPFFESRYRTHLIDSAAPYAKADGTYDLTPADIIRMEDEARKAAFKDTREVMYELAEHSEFAEMVGFMSPFFNAWQEVIGRWAGLAIENPAFVYKGVRLFTKDDVELPILGLTQEEDQYGNLNVVFRPSNSALASLLVNPKFTNSISDAANQVLPSSPIGSVGELVDEVGIKLDKDGLFTMLTKTTPSAGPFITLPLRTFMFDFKKPEIEEVAGWMFPFGHPDGNFAERLIQEFTPSWADHLYYTALDPDNPFRFGNKQNYGLTMIDMVTYLDVKAREAGTPYDYTDPEVQSSVIAKAEEMTQSVGFLKFLATTVIPVASAEGSPYEPYIIKLNELEEQGRALGLEPEWAVNQFLSIYGEEFFFLSGNATRNAKGVAPTIESFKLSQEHKDFIEKYPVMTSVVTNSLRVSAIEDGAFSPAVQQIFMNEGWREIYTPEEFIKQTEVSRGYTELNAWKDSPIDGVEGSPSYNQLLYANDGLSNSPSAAVHSGLKLYYDLKKAELSEKYPLFGEAIEEFSSSNYIAEVMEGARALVEEPSLAYKPWIGSLVEYLDIRNDFENDLRRLPSSSLEADNNRLLMYEWDQVRSEFATRPDFALFYSRFLENDLIPKNSWAD